MVHRGILTPLKVIYPSKRQRQGPLKSPFWENRHYGSIHNRDPLLPSGDRVPSFSGRVHLSATEAERTSTETDGGKTHPVSSWRIPVNDNYLEGHVNGRTTVTRTDHKNLSKDTMPPPYLDRPYWRQRSNARSLPAGANRRRQVTVQYSAQQRCQEEQRWKVSRINQRRT